MFSLVKNPPIDRGIPMILCIATCRSKFLLYGGGAYTLSHYSNTLGMCGNDQVAVRGLHHSVFVTSLQEKNTFIVEKVYGREWN